MAKKEKFDYSGEIKRLNAEGPQRLYLLYGEESYLREAFFAQVKKLCIGDADEGFDYRRIDGGTMEVSDFAEAVDAVPFLAERTLVEVRGFDMNHCREADADYLKGLLSDLPDYCTAVFIQSEDYVPDGRLALVKAMKKNGLALCFTAQDEAALSRWIAKRFSALGKSISRDDAEYLIFCAGTLMNGLVSEIEKLAAGSKGPAVTRADIDLMVQRIPEADVFEMVDMLGLGKYDMAASRLSALLATREEPIKLLALIGMQMRRIYAVKIAERSGLPRQRAMELAGVKYDFQYRKLLDSARRYTVSAIRGDVRLCADYDYKMKSSGGDPAELLTELFAFMASGALC